MRQSIDTSWEKALKRDDFFCLFEFLIGELRKEIEKCGLFNNRCQSIDTSWQQASIHTGQKCGPIEKIHIGRRDGGAMELSEICSTCMSRVRHTGQKMWTYLTLVQSI